MRYFRQPQLGDRGSLQVSHSPTPAGVRLEGPIRRAFLLADVQAVGNSELRAGTRGEKQGVSEEELRIRCWRKRAGPESGLDMSLPLLQIRAQRSGRGVAVGGRCRPAHLNVGAEQVDYAERCDQYKRVQGQLLPETYWTLGRFRAVGSGCPKYVSITLRPRPVGEQLTGCWKPEFKRRRMSRHTSVESGTILSEGKLRAVRNGRKRPVSRVSIARWAMLSTAKSNQSW